MNYDPMGETHKLTIYTKMKQLLQSMETLITEGQVNDIKTFEFDKKAYGMESIVITMSNRSLNSRKDTRRAPSVHHDASMRNLLLRLKRECYSH